MGAPQLCGAAAEGDSCNLRVTGTQGEGRAENHFFKEPRQRGHREGEGGHRGARVNNEARVRGFQGVATGLEGQS